MKTRWKVLGLGAAGGIALLTAVLFRPRPAPIAPAPPPVEVFGVAVFPEPLDRWAGGTLQVRLLDLTSKDSGAFLIASSTSNVAPRSISQGWTLRVPADRARFADDAYFVFSFTDHKGVRFIGSGFPRQFANKSPGAAPSHIRLGILLTAVPAP